MLRLRDVTGGPHIARRIAIWASSLPCFAGMVNSRAFWRSRSTRILGHKPLYTAEQESNQSLSVVRADWQETRAVTHRCAFKGASRSEAPALAPCTRRSQLRVSEDRAVGLALRRNVRCAPANCRAGGSANGSPSKSVSPLVIINFVRLTAALRGPILVVKALMAEKESLLWA